MEHILPRDSKIEVLSLAYNNNLYNAALYTIGSRCPHLTQLDISTSFANFSHEGIGNLASRVFGSDRRDPSKSLVVRVKGTGISTRDQQIQELLGDYEKLVIEDFRTDLFSAVITRYLFCTVVMIMQKFLK